MESTRVYSLTHNDFTLNQLFIIFIILELDLDVILTHSLHLKVQSVVASKQLLVFKDDAFDNPARLDDGNVQDALLLSQIRLDFIPHVFCCRQVATPYSTHWFARHVGSSVALLGILDGCLHILVLSFHLTDFISKFNLLPIDLQLLLRSLFGFFIVGDVVLFQVRSDVVSLYDSSGSDDHNLLLPTHTVVIVEYLGNASGILYFSSMHNLSTEVLPYFNLPRLEADQQEFVPIVK